MPIELITCEMTLSPTLGPMVRQGVEGVRTVRAVLAQVAQAGFTSVQLDATLSGIRPRELSPRARQDLSALLARNGLRPSGVDLFLPRKHWLETATVDRAVTAALGAIELAMDLGRVPVSLSLPMQGLGDDVRQALVTSAEAKGVRLAVHAEDQLDALANWVSATDLATLGIGLDPAALLVQGLKPDELVHRHAARLAVGRLADVTEAAGGLRCALGQGELDVLRFRIAMDLAKARHGPVVLDLRGLENPLQAMSMGKSVWESNAM